MNSRQTSVVFGLIGMGVGAWVMWLAGPVVHAPAPAAALRQGDPGRLRHGPLERADRTGILPGTDMARVEDLLAGARAGEVNQELLGAFRSTLNDPSPARRSRRFISLLEAMRAEDAAAVRKLFREGDREGRRLVSEWNAFWPRWGEVDGRGAFQNLTDLAASGEEAPWLSQVAGLAMEGWAVNEPDAARAWLAGKSPEEAEAWGLLSLARGLAARDLDAATSLAADPAYPPALKSRLYEQAAEAAVQTGSGQDLAAWLDRLPDEANRVAAFDHVLWRQFNRDPEAARQLVDRYRDLPWQNQNKVLPNLVEGLAQTDPAGATQWAAGLPASPDAGSINAVTRGFDRWIEVDPAAATAWLTPRQEEPYFDIAAYNTARKMIRSNHPGAQAWIDAISNPQMKESLLGLQQKQAGGGS